MTFDLFDVAPKTNALREINCFVNFHLDELFSVHTLAQFSTAVQNLNT
jgi:hypothetical protein